MKTEATYSNGKSQESRKRTGNASGAEEHGLSELAFTPAIPHRDIVSNTRVEPSLSHSQEQTSDEQALEVLHDAHERHDDAPGHHDGRQPDGRAEDLEAEVGRHFEGAVGEEEDGQLIRERKG